MSLYELVDENGYGGMVVGGIGVDKSFRQEADEAGRSDERLLDTTPEIALDPLIMHEAAVDCAASLLTKQVVTIAA